MQGTLDRLGPLTLERDSFTEFGQGMIVGTARWASGDAPQERWVVLSTDGYAITDMQVCTSRRKALQFAAGRHAAGARRGS